MTPAQHTQSMKSKLLQAESLVIAARITDPTDADLISIQNKLAELHTAMTAALTECGEGCGLSAAQVTYYAGSNKSA